MPPLRVRQAQNDPLSQNRHRRDLVGAETNAFGIRQPSLGGRGRLPFGEGEMSAKPTEGYGPVGREAVDEGNLYNQAKRDKVQALPLMSCRTAT